MHQGNKKTGKYLTIPANIPTFALPREDDLPPRQVPGCRWLSAWVMSGKSADDYNDRDDEHVRPEQQTIRVKDGSVSLPPHSITFLTIEP